MSKESYSETLRNCEKFAKNSRHSLAAKMIEDDGFKFTIHTEERDVEAKIILFEGSGELTIDYHTKIMCKADCTRSAVLIYGSKLIDIVSFANVCVAENGEVYIHFSCDVSRNPLEAEDLNKYEMVAMKLLREYGSPLEKIACGSLLDPFESDPKLLKMKSLDEAIHSHISGDDDEDDEDDEDELDLSGIMTDLDTDTDIPENIRTHEDNGLKSLADRVRRDTLFGSDTNRFVPPSLREAIERRSRELENAFSADNKDLKPDRERPESEVATDFMVIKKAEIDENISCSENAHGIDEVKGLNDLINTVFSGDGLELEAIQNEPKSEDESDKGDEGSVQD